MKLGRKRKELYGGRGLFFLVSLLSLLLLRTPVAQALPTGKSPAVVSAQEQIQAASLPEELVFKSEAAYNYNPASGETVAGATAQARFLAEKAAVAQVSVWLDQLPGTGAEHSFTPAQMQAAIWSFMQISSEDTKLKSGPTGSTVSVYLQIKIKSANWPQVLANRVLLDSAKELWLQNQQLLAESKNMSQGTVNLPQKIADNERCWQINNWLIQGNRCYLNKEYTAAVAAYDRAVELDGNSKLARLGRGSAFYFQGRYEEAIADYTAALAQQGQQQSILYYYRGNAYSYLQNYEAAIADYTAVLALEPADPNAFYNRGNCYRRQGLLPEAVADYSSALQLEPQMTAAYLNRGDIYSRSGQYEAAIADYSSVLAFAPGDEDALFSRAGLYSSQGNYELALVDYAALLASNPNLAAAYQNRGVIYLKKSLFPQALADFEQAVQLQPQYALAYYNKAVALEQSGLPDNGSEGGEAAAWRLRQIIDAYHCYLQYAPPNHPGIKRAKARLNALENRNEAQEPVLDI